MKSLLKCILIASFLTTPFFSSGQNDVDQTNALGVEMLYGFKYASKGMFNGEKIYNPVSGKTCQARIMILDETNAKIREYVAIPLFGRTEFCTKIEE